MILDMIVALRRLFGRRLYRFSVGEIQKFLYAPYLGWIFGRRGDVSTMRTALSYRDGARSWLDYVVTKQRLQLPSTTYALNIFIQPTESTYISLSNTIKKLDQVSVAFDKAMEPSTPSAPLTVPPTSPGWTIDPPFLWLADDLGLPPCSIAVHHPSVQVHALDDSAEGAAEARSALQTVQTFQLFA